MALSLVGSNRSFSSSCPAPNNGEDYMVIESESMSGNNIFLLIYYFELHREQLEI